MWACSLCSLENDAGHRRCALCNARQPPDISVPSDGVQPRRGNTPKKKSITSRTKERLSDTAEVMVTTTTGHSPPKVEAVATRLHRDSSVKSSRGRLSSSRSSTIEVPFDAANKDSAPLADVHCFIDVHLEGGQKASSALSGHLERLGAVVRTRFMAKVTHMIYQGGNADRAARSRAEGVAVVTPSWVEACRSQLTRVPEAGFQADISKTQKRPARALEPAADLQFLSPADALFSSSQRCDEEPEPRQAVKRRRVDLRIDELLSSEGGGATFNEGEATQKNINISLSGFEPAERAMLVKAIRAVNGRSKRPLRLCLDDDPMAEVTHLVVQESGRRTLRVVGALLHGAYFVNTSFVYTALDSGWPKEEEHEFKKWAPAKEVRSKVLQGHRIFVDTNQTSPPREALLCAVVLAGGEVVSELSNATLFLSSSTDKAPERRKKKIKHMTPGDFFDAIEEGAALAI